MGKVILQKMFKIAVGALIVMAVLSCARFQKLERNLRLIEEATFTFDGDITSAKYPKESVVIAFMSDEAGKDVLGYRVLEQAGYFQMTTGLTARKLLAFNDLNGDLKVQKDEPYAVYQRPLAGGKKRFDKITLDLKLASEQTQKLPEIFNNHGQLKYFKIKDKEVHTGTITSLMNPGFDLKYSKIGSWQPYRFITEGHTGVFFQEAYDPDKIPVLLIHGLGGSPLNFKAIIGEIDNKAYQPWLYSYAAGLSLETNASILKNLIVAMHHKYGFKKIHLVAHSMGGLVTRSALNKCVASHSCDFVSSFTSISTPWNGASTATRGANFTEGAVPVWTDMDPKGAFLTNLFNAPLPEHISHYLFFGLGSDNKISFTKSDGSVSLASQLRLVAQEQSTEVRGFASGHVSILSNEDVLRNLFDVLDAN